MAVAQILKLLLFKKWERDVGENYQGWAGWDREAKTTAQQSQDSSLWNRTQGVGIW